jgi:hypothetical protein
VTRRLGERRKAERWVTGARTAGRKRGERSAVPEAERAALPTSNNVAQAEQILAPLRGMRGLFCGFL